VTHEQSANANLRESLAMPTTEQYPERESLEMRALVYALLALVDEVGRIHTLIDENVRNFGRAR
jgi:hypothetical protein